MLSSQMQQTHWAQTLGSHIYLLVYNTWRGLPSDPTFSLVFNLVLFTHLKLYIYPCGSTTARHSTSQTSSWNPAQFRSQSCHTHSTVWARIRLFADTLLFIFYSPTKALFIAAPSLPQQQIQTCKKCTTLFMHIMKMALAVVEEIALSFKTQRCGTHRR